MTSIDETIQTVKADVFAAKRQLEAFITNKEGITLDERWQCWLEAPNFLKNTTPWVRHFTAFADLAEGEFKINKFERDVLYEHDQRGAVIDMVGWDEWLLNIASATDDYGSWQNGDGKPFTMDHYNAWREEVLAGNIGFVRFDW